jgi:hypothetical protein
MSCFAVQGKQLSFAQNKGPTFVEPLRFSVRPLTASKLPMSDLSPRHAVSPWLMSDCNAHRKLFLPSNAVVL